VRVEDVDRPIGVPLAAKPDVRADAGLLQLAERLRAAVRDVFGAGRVVLIDDEVAQREHREPRGVEVGALADAVDVRREVVRLVGVG
jgi:hypothetical protein